MAKQNKPMSDGTLLPWTFRRQVQSSNQKSRINYLKRKVKEKKNGQLFIGHLFHAR